MTESLSTIFRSRHEGTKGIIYYFDLIMVSDNGRNSALVGDCIVNISTNAASMRLSQRVPCSKAARFNFMDEVFDVAKGIEKNIYE